jgi:hypothetical protein
MTDGRCTLCGDLYTKRGMTRHLRSCKQEHLADGDEPTFHLSISDAHGADYWMHVEVERETTLATLDEFLRDSWLECCGHISAFTVDGVEYVKQFTEETGMSGLGGKRRDMDVTLGGLLEEGTEFTHEYDFGTTTELSLRVVDLGDGATGDEHGQKHGYRAIRVLARNEPPEIECETCGAPATSVCTQHRRMQAGEAWLCEECARAHECDDEFFLPVVNSPRVGVCGYTG